MGNNNINPKKDIFGIGGDDFLRSFDPSIPFSPYDEIFKSPKESAGSGSSNSCGYDSSSSGSTSSSPFSFFGLD